MHLQYEFQPRFNIESPTVYYYYFRWYKASARHGGGKSYRMVLYPMIYIPSQPIQANINHLNDIFTEVEVYLARAPLTLRSISI